MLRAILRLLLVAIVALAGACRDREPSAPAALLCTRFVDDTVLVVRDSVPLYEVVHRCIPPTGRR